MLKIESKNKLQLKQFLSNKFRNTTLNRNPNIYRPSSAPFISGDTLRKKSRHLFDETKTLNPRKVNKNDIVFIKTELKDIYFKKYHSKIEAPYILICHNSDDNFDEESKLNSDEKIIQLCREYMAKGWKHFKIKVGLDLDADVKRLELIRKTIGDDCFIMVDANQQ